MPDRHGAAHLACPRCGSQALNKNGRIKSGKQRYLCLVCGRQFVMPSRDMTLPPRPVCPICKRPMNVYARGDDYVRFRCANYPACRSYKKVALKKG